MPSSQPSRMDFDGETVRTVTFASPSQRLRTMAIVTLSRAQHELLEDLLDVELATTTEGERLLIGTPDRLQGEERDVVFVSIVPSPFGGITRLPISVSA